MFVNRATAYTIWPKTAIDLYQHELRGRILVKNVFLLFVIAFLLMFFLVERYSSTDFSEQPVALNKTQKPEITMFGTRSCKYCATARAFFEYHHLPFQENDIETSEKNLNLFYMLGGKGTPLLIVNGVIIYGFDEKAIRQAL